MIAIFCASKYSIVNRWKSLLVCKETHVAKNQKDLLEKVADDSFLPIVFIEERLYGPNISQLLNLLKTSRPNVILFVLSHMPSFHGGQAMLGFGAHGYGNAYMAKEWLNDAFNALLEGENWIFPLQEKPTVREQKVGKLEELKGKLVDKNSNPIQPSEKLFLNQKLLLMQGHARISLDFNNTILLEGREPIFLDETVFRPSQNKPLSAVTSTTSIKKLKKPFYINIGKESLVDRASDELFLQEAESEKNYSFLIEESDSFIAKERKIETLTLLGNIEEYEIIRSNSLSCVFINDSIPKRDGSHIVYGPIKSIIFANEKIDLSLVVD